MGPLFGDPVPPTMINDGSDTVSFTSGVAVPAGSQNLVNVMTIGSGNRCSAECVISGLGGRPCLQLDDLYR